MKTKLLLVLILVLLLSAIPGFADVLGGNNVSQTNMAADNITQTEVTMHAYYLSDAGTLTDQAKFYCNGSLFATVSAGGLNNWTTPQVTKTGLTAGTSYSFSVRFYKYPYDGTWINSDFTAWVTTGYSHTDTYTTDSPDPPSEITNLAAVPGLNNVQLSWSGGAGATKFEIYIDDGGILTYKGYTTGYSFNVTGLQSSTTYLFRVVAVNSGGTTSSYIYSTTLTPPPPSAITNLAAVPGYTSVTLSWSGGTYADKFEIYVNHTYVGYVSGSTFSYTKTGLLEGTTYLFEVVAVNNYGTSYSSISATTAISRPANFTGFLNLVSGTDVNVFAADWNTFTSKINAFRAYKGLSNVNFTWVTANTTVISANIYNEARNALNSLSAYFTGGYTIPAAKVVDESIYTTDFTRLKDALNSIV